LCPANKLTIGYGHVLLPAWDCVLFGPMHWQTLQRIIHDCQSRRRLTEEARLRLHINQAQADQLLAQDVQRDGQFLNSLLQQVELKQHQFDALASFVFNVGQGAFARSTLKRKLKAGDFAAAAREFERWVFATQNGKKVRLPGLVKRRQAERALFESGGR
jgi:lysozyme